MQHRGRIVRVLTPLLLAAIFVLAFRLLLSPYVIPTESMSPAIMPGDRVLATSLAGAPDRGDIITFRASESAARSCAVRGDTVFAKRVVGVAGDRVETRAGQVWVNGAPLDVPDAARPEYDRRWPVVPAEHVLVLGDNRNASCDSHVWRPDPFVPLAAVEGVVVARFWPLTRLGLP